METNMGQEEVSAEHSQAWHLMGSCRGVSNRIPDPKDRTDHPTTQHFLFFCFRIRECKLSAFPREK